MQGTRNTTFQKVLDAVGVSSNPRPIKLLKITPIMTLRVWIVPVIPEIFTGEHSLTNYCIRMIDDQGIFFFNE